MEIAGYYENLYRYQDQVLNAVNSIETGFYLTGGTCIHRFYSNMRYSDDLDFFCNDNDYFRDYIREVHDVLKKLSGNLHTVIDTRDFVRYDFENTLKVDFVNDRVFRLGKTIKTENGYKIDNLENICANKITAVMGRDEAKDIFDLYTISELTEMNWNDILTASLKKCQYEKDLLIDRLLSFPKDLLKNLNLISPVPDSDIITAINKIADIIQEL